MFFSGAKKNRAFIEAIEEGDLENVKRLIIEDNSFISGVLEARDESGLGPLHIAVLNCDMDLIKLLISYGISPDVPVSSGESTGYKPLHFAVAMNSSKFINFLLENGASIDITTSDATGVNATPLHHAAMLGKDEALRALLSAGANTLIHDGTGETALSWAKSQGHTTAYGILKQYEP